MQPYPATGIKFQISSNGGDAPRWRSDGKELYYISAAGKLTAVPITLGASPQWGAATALFDLSLTSTNPTAFPYAPGATGQKFLVRETLEDVEVRPVTVVTNWLAASKQVK